MTRYILAGGSDFSHPQYAKDLSAELESLSSKLTILSCLYSRSLEEWDVESSKWDDWFKQNFKSIAAHAVAGLDTLEEQAKSADVIYFHGGNTKLLLERLTEYEDLSTLFDGKTIIGSSAGANMLAKNYWSSTLQEPGRGRALVDANIMVHYGVSDFAGIKRSEQDWQNEEAQLRSFIGDSKQKIHHLAEGTFVTFDFEEN